MVVFMLKTLGLRELNKIMTIADKVLIILILIISISMLGLTPVLISKSAGEKDVVITLDNKELYRYNLEHSQKLERINFSFKIEGKEYQGTLRMKDGKVKLERLSQDISPLPIHAEMGWISEPYQMILCLPIKLAVTIENKNKQEEDVDIMSF
jgi:hypothetical protein